MFIGGGIIFFGFLLTIIFGVFMQFINFPLHYSFLIIAYMPTLICVAICSYFAHRACENLKVGPLHIILRYLLSTAVSVCMAYMVLRLIIHFLAIAEIISIVIHKGIMVNPFILGSTEWMLFIATVIICYIFYSLDYLGHSASHRCRYF